MLVKVSLVSIWWKGKFVPSRLNSLPGVVFVLFFFFFFFKERWILNFPIIQTAGCLGDNLKILKEKGVELPVLL